MKAFQSLLASGTPLGTWLMAAAPNTAEALGHAGFNFLVVDMEHVTIEFSDLAHILRAIGCTPSVPVVRLAWANQIMVKRAMDAGAETLMLPFIQTAEEAREAVSYMRYPPHGVRGVAAVHRGSRFGTLPGYLAGAHERAYSILQLETPEAVANLDAIAAVEGVDAVFVGPGDLSAAMGHIGDIGHKDVQELIAHAARAAAKAGKPIGIVGPNPTMVRRFLDYGYSFAAVSSDMGMMTSRAGEWLADLRQAQAPAASQSAY
ncbi:MAG: 2-dehydro-3-deoxyglucarate aldolase [Pelagibacterium sp. SCN 64-44]|nr:MAG: 2-dehydro-3-deoxyglucarate aldolase [Pelagibacterium sp. SCN 64-44]